ncbi:alpha-(1,3)-fucosyltransferase 7-like [Alosa pseudoharengus]|uniref:alpha-(1,3)-fucosyltransferase 7-like n=1 Tax=Alosa pseudoharengus TaxID=34774 RepID=UPI003F88A305
MKSSSRQEIHHQEHGTQYLTVCRRIFFFLFLLCITFTTYKFQQRQKSFIDPVNATMILVWHWPFGYSTQLNPNICSETYSIPNCVLMDNRYWFHRADFVVFHNRELITGSQRLPTDRPRPHYQRWVWFSLESPENNGNLRPFAGYFNYTMSYNRDADFYIPYGRLVPKKPVKGVTVDDFIPKNKSSLACWVVSNFSPRHKRTSVYNKLKKVIQVDVYGDPFNKYLSQSSLLPTISRCYFYLSFENSQFKDYITEKFWRNALLGGAVPVVLGAPRAHYEAVAPKGSFIHVDDFSSVEELGKYLTDLAEDKERYASYFTWHLNYTVQVGGTWEHRMCSICTMTDSLPPKQVYKDLQAWEWSKLINQYSYTKTE